MPTPNLSKKTRTMRVRLTEAEWEYITSIAESRKVNTSEALRWLIHQSILLTAILLETPEIVTRAKKLLTELPHMKEAMATSETQQNP